MAPCPPTCALPCPPPKLAPPPPPSPQLPAYVTLLLFFAGLLIRFSDIPKYWVWFSYIDVLR